MISLIALEFLYLHTLYSYSLVIAASENKCGVILLCANLFLYQINQSILIGKPDSVSFDRILVKLHFFVPCEEASFQSEMFPLTKLNSKLTKISIKAGCKFFIYYVSCK